MSMVSFERFEEILEELVHEIPDEYYVELNGGVFARTMWKIHPKSRGSELSVLGEYHIDYGLGRFVVLYYGSFQHVCPDVPEKDYRARMKSVLEHELTHHLESLAGQKDLEIKDAIQIHDYMVTGRTLTPTS